MAALLAATPAHAATTVITPPTLRTWQPYFVDSAVTQAHSAAAGATFVEGPTGQPSGVGSAHLVAAPGFGAVGLRSTGFARTRLSAITTLTYATYVTQTEGTKFPYLRLTLDLDGNGTRDDEIFFEPADQITPPLGIMPQPAPRQSAWQLWDARAGVWRTHGRLAGFPPRARLMSLDTIVATAPAAQIVDAKDGSGGVRIVSGDVASTSRFDGNVDAFTFGAAAADLTTYDFEPAPAAPAPPVEGKSAVVAAVEGTIRVLLPGQRYRTLRSGGENLPLGTIVDATKGRVAITTAASAAGTPQTAVFYDGTFKIGQGRGVRPITDIALRSVRFAIVCGRTTRTAARAGAAAAAAGAPIARATRKRPRSKRVVASLWGDGKGRFRTKGRNSAATVRGTRWLTQERCDGTLTRVARGVVSVKVNRTGRFVTVRAGHSYLARR
jgi:hypothetical protein